ncbi:unnamed protein product [Caenorhabditis auriculariae]|uniref:K Homology domain-containing protein n=1 Tax=Caenorhabditis auriculariae TaxID=2777116 RepID=A0A8S1HGX6_9PELO|nr:unnamed protein product [Caenorhabditis auriculariae]
MNVPAEDDAKCVGVKLKSKPHKTAQLSPQQEILTPPVSEVKHTSRGSESLHGTSENVTLHSSFSGEEQSISNDKKLVELLRERNQISTLPGGEKLDNLKKLLDKEIASLSLKARDEEIYDENRVSIETRSEEKKIMVSETLIVPVDKYPRYNFVGRILGPRGMTAKQLERDTGCKIFVRGRNTAKQNGQGNVGTSPISQNSTTNEPLNIYIESCDFPKKAEQKLANAVSIVKQLLSPPADGKDELKRKQLVDIAIINGTFRPTPATAFALQKPPAQASSHLSTPSTTEETNPRRPAVYRIPQQERSWLSPFFDATPPHTRRPSSRQLVSQIVTQTRRASDSVVAESSATSPLSSEAIDESLKVANSLLNSHKLVPNVHYPARIRNIARVQPTPARSTHANRAPFWLF